MNHLNKGGGFSGTEAYQTYDFLECPFCDRVAIEFYQTEFLDSTDVRPELILAKK